MANTSQNLNTERYSAIGSGLQGKKIPELIVETTSGSSHQFKWLHGFANDYRLLIDRAPNGQGLYNSGWLGHVEHHDVLTEVPITGNYYITLEYRLGGGEIKQITQEYTSTSADQLLWDDTQIWYDNGVWGESWGTP